VQTVSSAGRWCREVQAVQRQAEAGRGQVVGAEGRRGIGAVAGVQAEVVCSR